MKKAALLVFTVFASCGHLPDAAPVTPAENYRAKCSSCHDAGMADAPRIKQGADWTERLKRGKPAVYEIALKGKPGTAMLPKGGYTEFSDAEVIAIVDYMLSTLPAATLAVAKDARPKSAASPDTRSTVSHEVVSDDALLRSLQETYRKMPQLPASAIKIKVTDGRVTLEGVVDRSEQVSLAEATARGQRGVRQVENKLIPSSLFEWD